MLDCYGPGNKDGDAGINNALPKDPTPPPNGPEPVFDPNDVKIKGRRSIRGFMSNGAGLISDAYSAFMGNSSFFDMAERSSIGQKYKARKAEKDKEIDEMLKSDDEKTRKKGEKMAEKRDRMDNTISVGKKFEELGGFQELYKGFNEIRDTMFVNGAPQDWKNTAKEMDENKKLKDERKEYDFVHNEDNRQNLAVAMNLQEKAEKRYPGDVGKQQDWIDGKLDKELSQLAKSYLPLGVNDAGLAYSLRQDEKKYGYTPLQAYSNYAKGAGFAAFNINSNIVNQVNNATKGNYQNVSDAVPNAKDFWDNGYRDINHMQNAQMIKDKLQTSLDMAMKLEQALRNKGKVEYTGNDKAVEAKFKEINDYYKNMKKK